MQLKSKAFPLQMAASRSELVVWSSLIRSTRFDVIAGILDVHEEEYLYERMFHYSVLFRRLCSTGGNCTLDVYR